MKSTSIGVVVGRFQVAELTSGHREILDHVLAQGHNQTVLVLGVAATKATKNNPLDFDSRRRMIEEAYPGQFTILWFRDVADDHQWSRDIDKLIGTMAERRDVVLYGSRDSFIAHYFGKYRCEEYKQRLYCSGTEERDIAGKTVQGTREWRSGCIYATQNRYPTVYPTVDVAIFDGPENAPYEYLYLGRKPGEAKLRFVGGFTDVTDNSFQDAAVREAREETGLEVQFDAWIGSAKIDDWRYRSEEDKIITNLFAVRRIFGAAQAADDIEQIQRVLVSSLTEDQLVDAHRPLFRLMTEWLNNK